MNLLEVDKPEVKKTVVVYAGRFQPFHKGHFDAYQRLVSKFGAGNVYIGTSNDQSGPKSPFSFKDKKEIATKMFGIPASRFIQVRNPYQPVEILKKFDGQTTQYIAAVGEKDADRLQGKYFKPYKGKAGYGYDEIGYTYPIPAEVDPISGTDVRNNLGSGDTEKAKKFFLKAYPKFDKEIFKMITGKLNENFIKGYPSKEDVKKIQKKNDDIRAAATTDDSYVYDPISELIGRVAAEEIFNDFLAEYLGEAPNKALDVDITYTNTKGQQKKIKARDALRLPKDHPAHIQAAKIAAQPEPATEPKPKEEPGKAAQAAAKPAQPGQPVKQGQTQQGKTDKGVQPAAGEQGPPPEQKLSGAELKSSAETGESGEKSEKIKQALDNARKELSKEDNETIDKVNNPQSPERKGMVNNIKSGIQKFGKGLQHWADHKKEMVKGTWQGVKALANGQKIGSTKNKETGKWEYSDDKRKEQIKHMKHFALDAGLILGSMALGGAGVAGIKAAMAGQGVGGVASAAASGAAGAFTHGVGGFVGHLGKDIAKHATLETLGLGAFSTAGTGAGLSTVTGGILEIIGEEVDDNNKFIANFMRKVVEKMETFKMSDEQLLKSIENYKKNKPRQDAADLLKENLSETKQQSIQHFVEFATQRLKLKETPKISLVGGREFAEVKTSLGGFDPISKEIYVATEGRLTADILRTLAHEMVHRKQDEMGLVRNPMKDGADGSPIENQAHAVAGILMREYGRINKQIYNENVNETIKKVGDKYVVYPKKGGDRLGTHDTLASAKKQLAAIEINKEAIGDKKNVHNINLKLNDVSLKRFQSTPTFSRLLHRDQLKNLKVGDNKLVVNNTVWSALQRLEGPGNYKVEKLREDINVDIDKGDTVLMGKFKNKKVQVKNIGEDPHGMPTINGKQATTFRKVDEMGSNDIHLANIMKLYRNAMFRKRINAYLFGRVNMPANPNAVARALRNMDYKEITQMEKDLNIQADLSEVSNVQVSNTADIPDGSFIQKGKKRKLNSDKGEDWYVNGGYTQTDFPKADAIFGDEDGDERVVKYTIDNLPRVAFTPTEFIKEGVKELEKERDKLFLKALKMMPQSPAQMKVRAELDKVMAQLKKLKKESINESLLLEGGAYGHMSHPFDDMELTFGDLKNIITMALNGELGVVREKTDGQALAISWKNGRLIAARNKGHLAKAGANAMGIEGVASKFAGRGGLTDAYNFAMRDLSAAIGGLSQKQREKIFGEGKNFMNLEVIWPESVNVIPYGQALLVFHNCIEYDESGSAIGQVAGAETLLAKMIKQINADVQSKYTIQGPPVTSIPKNENLSAKQGKYLSRLQKLQSQFKLNDNDTVAVYHQSWWENFINTKAPVKVDKLTKEALVRRWAFGDKGFRLNTISNPELQKWAMDNDKVNVPKQQKDNMKPFEEIFLGVGADVLDFVSSVLTVHPEKAIRSIKDRFKSVAAEVRGSGDTAKIQKLKSELKRLNSLGGVERIVASEGLVFFYNGKTYKLTGTFAPLNQILGLFY